MRRHFLGLLASLACYVTFLSGVHHLAIADEGSAEKQTAVFAFVPLRADRSPTEAQIRTAIATHVGKDAQVNHVTIDDKSVTLEVDGAVVMYGHINRPIPTKDLEWAYVASWTWPEAESAVKSHRSHLLVMVVPRTRSQVEDGVLLTKLLAAGTEFFDCAGVYWGHASLLLSPEQVRKLAAGSSADQPPVLAWVSFNRLPSERGSLSVGTLGLSYFGCRELEVINSRRPIPDILNVLGGIAHILLKGEVIADGDTVGQDNEQKIKTRYAKSVREDVGEVLRVEF